MLVITTVQFLCLTNNLTVICVMQRAIKNTRMFSFLPNSDLSAELGRNLCRDRVIARTICENILLMLGGFGSTQVNAVSCLSIEIYALL
jgi:hypothetical protein